MYNEYCDGKDVIGNFLFKNLIKIFNNWILIYYI